MDPTLYMTGLTCVAPLVRVRCDRCQTRRWEADGWNRGGKVRNEDMWMLLLQKIRQLRNNGVNVSIWRIPREWNEKADEAAKYGATFDSADFFTRIVADGLVSVKSITTLYA
jgi:hypothetical protein